MHTIPVRPGQPPKELGVNIADWSIIGPGFWHLYQVHGRFFKPMANSMMALSFFLIVGPLNATNRRLGVEILLCFQLFLTLCNV